MGYIPPSASALMGVSGGYIPPTSLCSLHCLDSPRAPQPRLGEPPPCRMEEFIKADGNLQGSHGRPWNPLRWGNNCFYARDKRLTGGPNLRSLHKQKDCWGRGVAEVEVTEAHSGRGGGDFLRHCDY